MKKRKDGRYKKNVYIGLDADGKKKYKTIYGYSIKELNEAEYRLRLELHRNYDLLQDDSFTTWADAYVESQRTRQTPSEHSTIKARTDYLKDYFDGRSLKNIRLLDVQGMMAALARENPATGKPSARRTIERYRSLLSRIFQYAIANRVADYDPTTGAKAPKDASVHDRRALTVEERRRIEEFEHPAQLAMMLMLYSGLRRGEAGALLWSDIDLKNRTISVTKSMDYKQGVIKPPKNGKSRVVTIPKVLADFLAKTPHRGAQVLLSRSGKPMTESAWQKQLEAYLNAQNIHYAYKDKISLHDPRGVPMLIEPYTYHCLRHTFCTLMYEAGVDVLVAMEQMGHSDVKTTLSIYTHLSNEHKTQDISKLDLMLGGSKTGQQTTKNPVTEPLPED